MKYNSLTSPIKLLKILKEQVLTLPNDLPKDSAEGTEREKFDSGNIEFDSGMYLVKHIIPQLRKFKADVARAINQGKFITQVQVVASESLVPNKDGEKPNNPDLKPGVLAAARATHITQWLLNSLRDDDSLKNVQVLDPIALTGKIPWDSTKGKDHSDYTKDQFVRIEVFVDKGVDKKKFDLDIMLLSPSHAGKTSPGGGQLYWNRFGTGEWKANSRQNFYSLIKGYSADKPHGMTPERWNNFKVANPDKLKMFQDLDKVLKSSPDLRDLLTNKASELAAQVNSLEFAEKGDRIGQSVAIKGVENVLKFLAWAKK